jgi:hypothetical protein
VSKFKRSANENWNNLVTTAPRGHFEFYPLRDRAGLEEDL